MGLLASIGSIQVGGQRRVPGSGEAASKAVGILPGTTRHSETQARPSPSSAHFWLTWSGCPPLPQCPPWKESVTASPQECLVETLELGLGAVLLPQKPCLGPGCSCYVLRPRREAPNGLALGPVACHVRAQSIAGCPVPHTFLCGPTQVPRTSI